MSLVNAVHTLLEVAAGRLNLTPQAADELHASIDADQNPPQAPDPTPDPPPAESSAGPSTSEPGAPWPS